MKLRPRPSLTQPQIFDGGYEHPWYKQTLELYGDNNLELYRPKPPSKEAITRAKFVDKTFRWDRNTRN